MHKYVNICVCVQMYKSEFACVCVTLVCVCVCVLPMPGGMNEVALVPPGSHNGFGLPIIVPKTEFACFLPDTESDAGCYLGQHPPPHPHSKSNCLQKNEAG